MNRWKEIVLQEGIEAIIDYRGKTPPKSTTGIPLISAANIKSGKLEFSKTNFISIQDYNKWTTRGYTKPFDVLITTEAPVGEVALYPDDGKTYLISRRVIALRADEKILNSKFLLYLLQYDHVLKILRGNNRGSTVSRVLKTDITGLKLKVPHFKDQCRISKVLFDIDSKIELNNKITMELESMAKLIYDYWFVQFDFPDKNGNPYKSSGGKMVYDDKLNREIPEGWEVKHIQDIGTCIMGQSPKGDSYNKEGIGIPLLNGPADYENGSLCGRTFTTLPTRLCQKDDLVLCIRATIGNLVYAESEFCLGRGVAAVRPRIENSSEYVYYLLENEIKVFKIRATGSIIKGITKDDLTLAKVPLPKSDLLKTFSSLIKPQFDKIRFNKRENAELTKLRDWLLPMLMNGQVTIKD